MADDRKVRDLAERLTKVAFETRDTFQRVHGPDGYRRQVRPWQRMLESEPETRAGMPVVAAVRIAWELKQAGRDPHRRQAKWLLCAAIELMIDAEESPPPKPAPSKPTPARPIAAVRSARSVSVTYDV